MRDTEFRQERRHIPGLDATPTGPAIGPDDRSDDTTDVSALLARSSDAVHRRNLSPEERADFDAAEAAEWKAIGSVRVLDPVAADTVRRERPDRVINSRMVRRHMPQEGTFQKTKIKSRWCVLRHHDPDAADMFTHAPAPCAT